MNAPSSIEETAEAAVETLPLPPGRRLGEFLITRVVGQGGFGIVYEAEDLALQRRIAIKEYMPSQLATRTDGVKVQPISARCEKTFELGRKSFIAEARLLAQFRHPGLLEVLHFWSQNGTAYMAMPFYEGRTLDKVLATSRGVMSEKWLGAMIRPVLDALEHMHGEDCYHRDVSADNILIREDGKAMLLDLGAARHVIGDRERAMTMMLKPGYAPIEQYADDPACRQGPWTDIYAVAAVLYFAVTAKLPPASASRVMHDTLPPLAALRPRGYGQRFLEAIDRGLAIRPEQRPRTVAEFRSLLFSVAPGDAAAARAGGASERERGLDPRRARPAEAARGAERTDKGRSPGRADGAARAQDGARADAARSAAREHKRTSAARGHGAPMFAAAAIVCAVAVAIAWIVWPSDRSAQIGEGRQATLVQPPGAAAVAAAVPAARSAGDRAPPAAAALPSQTAGGDTQSGRAAVSPSTPRAASAGPEMRAATNATSAASKRSTTKNAPAAPARRKSGPASKAAPVVANADAQTSGADEAAASQKTGSLRLSVAPWGEVFVDGASRGVTPPLKQLVLGVGTHRIEIRNPAGPTWSKEIVVRPGQQEVLSHRFQ